MKQRIEKFVKKGMGKAPSNGKLVLMAKLKGSKEASKMGVPLSNYLDIKENDGKGGQGKESGDNKE